MEIIKGLLLKKKIRTAVALGFTTFMMSSNPVSAGIIEDFIDLVETTTGVGFGEAQVAGDNEHRVVSQGLFSFPWGVAVGGKIALPDAVPIVGGMEIFNAPANIAGAKGVNSSVDIGGATMLGSIGFFDGDASAATASGTDSRVTIGNATATVAYSTPDPANLLVDWLASGFSLDISKLDDLAVGKGEVHAASATGERSEINIGNLAMVGAIGEKGTAASAVGKDSKVTMGNGVMIGSFGDGSKAGSAIGEGSAVETSIGTAIGSFGADSYAASALGDNSNVRLQEANLTLAIGNRSGAAVAGGENSKVVIDNLSFVAAVGDGAQAAVASGKNSDIDAQGGGIFAAFGGINGDAIAASATGEGSNVDLGNASVVIAGSLANPLEQIGEFIGDVFQGKIDFGTLSPEDLVAGNGQAHAASAVGKDSKVDIANLTMVMALGKESTAASAVGDGSATTIGNGVVVNVIGDGAKAASATGEGSSVATSIGTAIASFGDDSYSASALGSNSNVRLQEGTVAVALGNDSGVAVAGGEGSKVTIDNLSILAGVGDGVQVANASGKNSEVKAHSGVAIAAFGGINADASAASATGEGSHVDLGHASVVVAGSLANPLEPIGEFISDVFKGQINFNTLDLDNFVAGNGQADAASAMGKNSRVDIDNATAVLALGKNSNVASATGEGAFVNIESGVAITAIGSGSSVASATGEGSEVKAGNLNVLWVTGDNSQVAAATGVNSTTTIGSYSTINALSDGSQAVYADGSGATVNIGNVTVVTVEGDDARAVHANNEGTVNMDGYSIVATIGDRAHAVHAENKGTINIGDGVQIGTASADARAVFAESGGQIHVGDNANIGTLWAGSHVVSATGAGSLAEVGDNATLTPVMANTHAAYASDNGKVVIGDHAKIESAFLTGILARNAHMAFAESGGQVEVGNDAYIKTWGQDSYAAHATGADSKVTVGDRSKIWTMSNDTIFGVGTHGVYAKDGGQVNIGNDASLVTLGKNSYVAYADGAGSEVNVGDNARIATMYPNLISISGNDGSHAVYGTNSGTVNVGDDAAITTIGFWSNAGFADNGGAVNIGDNAKIGTIGYQAKVARAESGGQVTVGDNAELVTYNWGAHVASADGAGSKTTIGNDAHIKATKGDIETPEVNVFGLFTIPSINILPASYAAYASNSGEVVIGDRALIETSGIDAHAIFADTNGKVTVGDGARAVLNYDGANVAYAINGGDVVVGDKAYLQVYGKGAYTVRADGTGSSVAVGINGDVITSQDEIHATSAVNGGSVAIGKGGSTPAGQETRLNTSGDRAYGSYTSGAGSTTNLEAYIRTTGAGAHGVVAENEGAVTGGGVRVFVKDGNTAILARDKGTIDLQNRGVAVADATGKAIHATGDGSSVSLSGNWTTNHDILAEDKAKLTLDMNQNSRIYSGISTQTGAESTVKLSGNAQWHMPKDSNITNLDMADNSWVYFGSPVVPTVSSARTLLGAPAGVFVPTALSTSTAYQGPHNTLTVENLSGTGNFFMRADMENNNKDLLKVTNSDSGSHQLLFTDHASVTLSDIDQKLVVVETPSGTATFAMYPGTFVEIGEHKYYVERDPSDATNWYLKRGVPSNGSSGEGRLTPSAQAGMLAPQASYMLSYAEMSTLMQRMGDLRQQVKDGTTDPAGNVWARVYNGGFSIGSNSYASGFDQDYTGFQVGVDKRIRGEKGDTYLGAFFGYTDSSQDYDNNSSGSITAKSLGAYGTFIGNNGFYVDGVLKFGTFSNRYEGISGGLNEVVAKDTSNGFGASLEVGQRIYMDKKKQGGLYFEPQLQLNFAHQDGSEYETSHGLDIDVSSYDSIMGRVGTLIGYEMKGGENPINVYGKVSFVKEFSGDYDIAYNYGKPYGVDMDDSWLVWGAGISANFSKKHTLYLDVEKATGANFDQDWQINGGYRFQW